VLQVSPTRMTGTLRERPRALAAERRRARILAWASIDNAKDGISLRPWMIFQGVKRDLFDIRVN
jgi:hypothetical protein